MTDDDRDTDPDIPSEIPTAPDLARPLCLFCKGTKELMRTEEWGSSRYRVRRTRCDRCDSDGRVTREEAERQREIQRATED